MIKKHFELYSMASNDVYQFTSSQNSRVEPCSRSMKRCWASACLEGAE